MKTNKIYIILSLLIFGFLIYLFLKGPSDEKVKIENKDILLEDKDTKVSKKITTISNVVKVTNPTISPNNENLIVFTNDNLNGLYTYNTKTEKQKKLTNEIGAGYNYSWSSDGQSICYRVTTINNNNVRMQQIKLVNLNTNKITNISEKERSLSNPVWLEINALKKIAYFSKDGLKFSEVLVSKKSKTSIKKDKNVIYNFFNGNLCLVHYNGEISLIEKNAQAYDPLISPDNKSIVYSTLSGLVIYDINSKTKNNIGTGIYPSWSPLSNEIVYQRCTDDGERVLSSDLYIYSINDKKAIKFTDTKELEYYPQWRNKDTILYTKNNNKIFLKSRILEQKNKNL